MISSFGTSKRHGLNGLLVTASTSCWKEGKPPPWRTTDESRDNTFPDDRTLLPRRAPRQELLGARLPGPPQRYKDQRTVYDGAGEVVLDAMVEIWQAMTAGRYNHPADDRSSQYLDEDFLRLRALGHRCRRRVLL